MSDEVKELDLITKESGVFCTIGGQRKNLYLSMSGMRYLAKKYGGVQAALKHISNIQGTGDLTEEGIEAICDTIIACRVFEERDISLDALSDSISPGELMLAAQAAAQAIMEGMPKADPTRAAQAK